MFMICLILGILFLQRLHQVGYCLLVCTESLKFLPPLLPLLVLCVCVCVCSNTFSPEFVMFANTKKDLGM